MTEKPIIKVSFLNPFLEGILERYMFMKLKTPPFYVFSVTTYVFKICNLTVTFQIVVILLMTIHHPADVAVYEIAKKENCD